MKTQKEYWEGRILEWEDHAFGAEKPRPLSLIERMAQPFRGPVRHRRDVAWNVLQQEKPQRILELGCGSGRFAFSLVTQADVQHVTGVDISEQAIQVAQNKAASLNLTGKLSFIYSSISDLNFEAQKPFDYVVGLGLTPYLTDQEFTKLFSAIKGTRFFFDVHPKGISLQNSAHAFYRMVKGHPFYYRYTKQEIMDKLAKLGITGVEWKRAGDVWYIQK